MSETQAITPEKEAPKRVRMKRRNKILLILVSLIAMAVLRTGFVFLVIAILPSVVVYYFDQSPQRYRFKTIFFCNLSGVLPFLGRLLHYGPNSAALHEVMGSAATWFIIYGSAAIGGLLIAMTPLLAQGLISSMHQTQIARLQRMQRKIEQEWGTEVTQFSIVTEQDV